MTGFTPADFTPAYCYLYDWSEKLVGEDGGYGTVAKAIIQGRAIGPIRETIAEHVGALNDIEWENIRRMMEVEIHKVHGTELETLRQEWLSDLETVREFHRD